MKQFLLSCRAGFDENLSCSKQFLRLKGTWNKVVKTEYSRSLGKVSICVQKRLGKMKKYGKKGTPKNVCEEAIKQAIYRCTEYRNTGK